LLSIRSEYRGDDLEQLGEPGEVVGVERVERELAGQGNGGDEQIDGAASASLASSDGERGVDAAVGTSRGCVERKRLERRFGLLKPFLPARSLARVRGGMWAGRELGERDRRDGQLLRQRWRTP
jgi:hypothetical protein